MELPLSRREWKLYKELKRLFSNDKNQVFASTGFNKYEEWLILLTQKDVLSQIRADGATIYCLKTSFAEFELWIKDQDKKSKRVSKREWRIGIISAIIGAITGSFMPMIIQMLFR